MLRMNLGTSVGSRRPLFHFEESQVHERINISIGSSDKLTDVQQEVEQEEDVEEEHLEKKPAREIYYNTLCYYYWHAKGGCTRPDCHFIHDENMSKDQDTSTKPSDGKVSEVKVFLRNIPPRMGKRDIALLVEPHGDIKLIHLLPSQLASGRQAAIILMTNEIHADSAVEALNRHVDYTGELLWAEKQTVIPLPKQLPKQENTPIDDDDDPLPTMSEMGKLRESRRKSTPSPSSVLTNNISNNMWCVLCEDADNAEDTDEQVPTMLTQKPSSKNINTPKPVDNPVVTGIWADTDRKNTMIHKLIFED